jgi:hypothetical protein
MPIRDKLPISAAYDDGVLLRYRVTDDSSTQEINEGVFTAPDQLTRDTLIISSTGDFCQLANYWTTYYNSACDSSNM